MKEILKAICETKAVSASALSNKLGSSRGFVKSVNYKKEDQLLYKLITIYPDLNPYYLITGQGPMTIDIQGNSKIAKLGSALADYKILYDQLRVMYDDVIKDNRHMESVNKTLMKQNAALIERLNLLTENE